MVVLLVILMVAVLLAAQYFLKPGLPETDPAAPQQLSPAAVKVRQRYLHPGHAWAVLQGTRSALLGAADLAPRLLGRVEGVDLPVEGQRLRQGEPFLTLHRGRKLIRLVAPLSGVVTEVNRALLTRPGLVNDSPYDEGWAVRVTPDRARTEVGNLLSGSPAVQWQDVARIELARWFAPTAGPALADGGLAVEDLSDRLSDDEWDRLVKEFFPRGLPTEDLGTASSKERES